MYARGYDGPVDESMDRRRFWRNLLGRALPRPEALPGYAPSAHAEHSPHALRPPGAVAEAIFLERCAPDCRLCVDACPVCAIVPSYDADQPGGGDGRPHLLPDRQACVLCGLCMPACPTGALRETPPEDVRIGRAHLEAAACLRTRGEACSVCLERCPFGERVLRNGPVLPQILLDGCTGCGLCAEACPPHAIRVAP